VGKMLFFSINSLNLCLRLKYQFWNSRLEIYQERLPPGIARETLAKATASMGGFQRAGTGKNKTVIENSPLLAF